MAGRKRGGQLGNTNAVRHGVLQPIFQAGGIERPGECRRGGAVDQSLELRVDLPRQHTRYTLRITGLAPWYSLCKSTASCRIK
jgi:hypothetical protein